MTGWAGSTRRATLPHDWPKRRAACKRRAGGRCQWITDGQRCTAKGTECDHIGDPDNHEPDNLQWLCHPHHFAKTLATRPAARARRPQRQHPGLINPES